MKQISPSSKTVPQNKQTDLSPSNKKLPNADVQFEDNDALWNQAYDDIMKMDPKADEGSKSNLQDNSKSETESTNTQISDSTQLTQEMYDIALKTAQNIANELKLVDKKEI